MSAVKKKPSKPNPIRPELIVFEHDKHGRRIAYHIAFSARSGRRKIRMSLAEAEAILAAAAPPPKKGNPSSEGAAVKEAIAQYQRDHWGQPGPRGVRALPAADPRLLSIELGALVAVVYRTRKGKDRSPTDYEHEFNEPLPVLSYNRTGLIISGGAYHVEERGIVD